MQDFNWSPNINCLWRYWLFIYLLMRCCLCCQSASVGSGLWRVTPRSSGSIWLKVLRTESHLRTDTCTALLLRTSCPRSVTWLNTRWDFSPCLTAPHVMWCNDESCYESNWDIGYYLSRDWHLQKKHILTYFSWVISVECLNDFKNEFENENSLLQCRKQTNILLISKLISYNKLILYNNDISIQVRWVYTGLNLQQVRCCYWIYLALILILISSVQAFNLLYRQPQE